MTSKPHSELIAQFERELIAARIDNARLEEQLKVARKAGDDLREYVMRLEEQLEALRAGLESLKGDEKVIMDGMKWKAARIVSYAVLNQRINAILDGVSNPARSSDA